MTPVLDTIVSIFLLPHLPMNISRHSKTTNSLSPVIVGALFLALVAGCSGSSTQGEPTSLAPEQSSSSSDSSIPSVPVSSEAAVIPKRNYADGTFAAAGTYRSPEGNEEIQVSLTIKNNVVVDGSIQGMATNPRSIKFQGLFAQGFSQAVVGKSIDSLNLTVVNGSSLTPAGFMNALEQIKTKAVA